MLGEISNRLADALAAVVDILRWNSPPPKLKPFLFGARLFALRKKDGSLRPIACSSTLRRIAAKVACKENRDTISEALGHNQLGFAKPGGLEAAIHATRSFLSTRTSHTVLVKLDFQNAFNSLRRDHMLRSVCEFAPELFHLVDLAYQEPSHLLYEGETLSSASGVQQGDPLGPALFCLGIRNLVSSLKSPLNTWYLDDCLLGGDIGTVLEDIQRALDFQLVSGLSLNPKKCEVFWPHAAPSGTVDQLSRVLPGCSITTKDSLELLGSPLLQEGFGKALDSHRDKLWAMLERLPLLGAHRGLFLLRSSLSASRIHHILRGCDLSEYPDLLQPFNELTVDSLSTLLNLRLEPSEVTQAFLPVALGGLGLPDAVAVAGPATVSSMFKCSELVRGLLQNDAWNHFVDTRDALAAKLSASDGQLPEKPEQQNQWSSKLYEKRLDSLLSTATSDTDKARLRAVSRPAAGAWLHAIPSGATGTLLDDTSARICVGLRLGSRLVEPHVCACGEPVDARARHGLSCARSAGRGPRHASINDTFARALRSAGLPCIREPPGLLRDDGRRPDGMSLVPFEKGQALVWDGTVSDSLAPSIVGHGATRPGHAAMLAEQTKLRKYSALQHSYAFAPLAFETLGGPGPLTQQLLHKVCDLLVASTGDKRAGTFFTQRLSLDVQRGNATAIMGTLAAWCRPNLAGG